MVKETTTERQRRNTGSRKLERFLRPRPSRAIRVSIRFEKRCKKRRKRNKSRDRKAIEESYRRHQPDIIRLSQLKHPIFPRLSVLFVRWRPFNEVDKGLRSRRVERGGGDDVQRMISSLELHALKKIWGLWKIEKTWMVVEKYQTTRM